LPLNTKRQTFIALNSEDNEENSIVKVTFTPIKPQGQEEMVSLITILQDVTEEEKLDRQRKDFVANVSHELRTPLTTIKSYLESLEDGAIHDPELAIRFLKVARQESDRMTRLINDLLQLSKLDAKQTRFVKKATTLSTMLEDVVDRFSMQCEQKKIDISLQILSYLPQVYADRDKIDQVLDNLLSNAVKFTPEGGKIVVSAKRQKNGMVEVSVADTGIGIPKKDLSRIFERFYRVDKARSRSMGGTGLGLAIAQEIIRYHEGEIWITSEYQKGTKVSFTLPPCEPEVIG
jgi:two-component system sensor histidine kinase VicK